MLCPPKSTTPYRDLPADQHIGGYPRPSQLSTLLDPESLDSEGRCVVLEFPAFVLIGVYSPAARDETRDDFRTGFVEAMECRVRNLVAAGKQVILTGDLNIVRGEIDTSNLSERLRKENMTIEQWMSMPTRRIFNQLIFEGHFTGPRDENRDHPVLWDICRCFHPTREAMNTCWDTKKNTRPANFGSRIDYVLCSAGLKGWVTESNIQEGLMGSDHCPVFATLSDKVSDNSGSTVHLLDVMHPPGMFRDGQRQREWSSKDLLPLSARLIPEFDGRRSIKDMFTKRAPALNGTEWNNGSTEWRSDLLQTTLPENSAATSITISESQNHESQPTNTSTAPSTPQPSEYTDAIANTYPGAARGSVSASTSQWDGIDGPKFPSTSTNTQSLALKRPLDSNEPPTSRSSKRGKASDSKSNQRTLRGFFKPLQTGSPKGKGNSLDETNDNSQGRGPSTIIGAPTTNPTSSPRRTTRPPSNSSPRQKTPHESTPSESDINNTTPWPQTEEKFIDPIESKESWAKLLGKRVLPRCEHGEPCISLTTKKPGINCGMYLLISRICIAHLIALPCRIAVISRVSGRKLQSSHPTAVAPSSPRACPRQCALEHSTSLKLG